MDDLFHLRHFTTGEYNKNRTFLSDEDYSLALDVFVKGCADVMLCDPLSHQRSVQPQKDWWFLGGRMQAGEEPHVTAARHVRREAGVDLAPQRFRA
ncbi:NUDIX hydrolase domain-like, partial [Haematococcus lacustris]